ncbi:uncharacterized protein F5891DRAFT_986817 [Suillus fuscotomentosus]|uniref:Uncharacterized protein n=1 Tax=Suillus fuscotomentosus TaxID=1912939 RepID=A0AAD4DSL9_9AGAM|nr:uncharacterized protein F5891DRAFT_986817 [Suillus fuscotomentosus]KAG1890724.1 hypothetical protein F5891DRAFT_986817 [Suillus fuscotomentosus]
MDGATLLVVAKGKLNSHVVRFYSNESNPLHFKFQSLVSCPADVPLELRLAYDSTFAQPALRIEVTPLPGTPTDLNSPLYCTALALLDTLHRYLWGALTHYQKCVQHDILIQNPNARQSSRKHSQSAAHLPALYDTLLQQNLLRIVEPYSVVEIEYVAKLEEYIEKIHYSDPYSLQLSAAVPRRSMAQTSHSKHSSQIAKLQCVIDSAEGGVLASFCPQIDIKNVWEFEERQLKVTEEESQARLRFDQQVARLTRQGAIEADTFLLADAHLPHKFPMQPDHPVSLYAFGTTSPSNVSPCTTSSTYAHSAIRFKAFQYSTVIQEQSQFQEQSQSQSHSSSVPQTRESPTFPFDICRASDHSAHHLAAASFRATHPAFKPFISPHKQFTKPALSESASDPFTSTRTQFAKPPPLTFFTTSLFANTSRRSLW